jgi:RNA polymerase sigma factor (sigma-70 family)
MTNWDVILAEHGPAVWGTLWRLLADRADVEDCFQETFIAALKYSRRQGVESWPALLCHLATRRAMDRLRKRYRESKRERILTLAEHGHAPRLAEVVSTAASPVEQVVAAELSDRLREALAELPARQAEVFYLHELCAWSRREIAGRLNMKEGAVGVTIHRARRQLQTKLGNLQ